ncbi:ankyrin [Cenococcum geophilum 1.58]|uniref:ankyrin n=1 Tax=Cenococcum geophilum 1.58 TaxID=794803 RepID=UPI00358FF30C|nr:ankyrin [Cenococcum geophilum 1.58]
MSTRFAEISAILQIVLQNQNRIALSSSPPAARSSLAQSVVRTENNLEPASWNQRCRENSSSFRFDRRALCNCDCKCHCHAHRNISRIQISALKRFAGTLSVTVSGISFGGLIACNDPTCRRASIKSFELLYSFPAWLMNLSIFMFFTSSYAGPTVGLGLRRRVRWVTETGVRSMHWYVDRGDMSAVKTMLEQHRESVQDVEIGLGRSVLHHALSHGHTEVTKLLLAAGADPFMEDDYGRPAIQLAARSLIRHTHSPSRHQELQDMLPWWTYVEECDFSHIHRVVLGLRPLTLQEELRTPVYRAQIHLKDNTGSTPLHWAVYRNDFVSVQALLQAGADLNVIDNGGYTPLLLACRINALQCARVLLEAGADIHLYNRHGHCPVHEATLMGDAALLSLLLSYGADVNARRPPLMCSALGFAAEHKNAGAVAFLLSHGANINGQDNAGDSVASRSETERSRVSGTPLTRWRRLHNGEQKRFHCATRGGFES